MKYYYVVLDVKPSHKNIKHRDLSGAHFCFVVLGEDPVQSERLARQYSDSRMWTVISCRTVEDISDRPLSDLSQLQLKLCPKAFDRGIAGSIIAWESS